MSQGRLRQRRYEQGTTLARGRCEGWNAESWLQQVAAQGRLMRSRHDELQHDELQHDELQHDELQHDDLQHDELQYEERIVHGESYACYSYFSYTPAYLIDPYSIMFTKPPYKKVCLHHTP